MKDLFLAQFVEERDAQTSTRLFQPVSSPPLGQRHPAWGLGRRQLRKTGHFISSAEALVKNQLFSLFGLLFHSLKV